MSKRVVLCCKNSVIASYFLFLSAPRKLHAVCKDRRVPPEHQELPELRELRELQVSRDLQDVPVVTEAGNSALGYLAKQRTPGIMVRFM